MAESDKWPVGYYTRRKGGCPLTYVIAETSETGARLVVVKGGQPRGLGRWHSWKSLSWDWITAAEEPPLSSYKLRYRA